MTDKKMRFRMTRPERHTEEEQRRTAERQMVGRRKVGCLNGGASRMEGVLGGVSDGCARVLGLSDGCARVLGAWCRGVCPRAGGLSVGCARVLRAWVMGVPAC